MKKIILSILLVVISKSVFCAGLISGLVFPYREVILSSPVQNFITELQVREGDKVSAGDKMAQL